MRSPRSARARNPRWKPRSPRTAPSSPTTGPATGRRWSSSWARSATVTRSLLTGAGGNAAFWFPHVAALAEDGPVYGIDMPGDANPSVPRALMTPPASCTAWLDELLGKLSDRPAHLVGFSYGGWVAMNQALRAPGRVASITLLDPAGLTRPDARFYRWLTISGLATLTPMPLRRRLARWLDLPHMLEPELMTLMWAAIRGYRAEPKFPGVDRKSEEH